MGADFGDALRELARNDEIPADYGGRGPPLGDGADELEMLEAVCVLNAGGAVDFLDDAPARSPAAGGSDAEAPPPPRPPSMISDDDAPWWRRALPRTNSATRARPGRGPPRVVAAPSRPRRGSDEIAAPPRPRRG